MTMTVNSVEANPEKKNAWWCHSWKEIHKPTAMTPILAAKPPDTRPSTAFSNSM